MSRTFVVAVCAVVLGVSLVACSQPATETGDRDVTAPTDAASVSTPAEVTQEGPGVEAAPAAEESAPRVTPHIALYPVDDTGTSYALEYGDEVFEVYYQPDVWSVYESYRITDHDDLITICQMLVDEHPIHGRDYESYRTAEDMAYEWEQHNYAYELLPADNPWRESVSNVDLDPGDQGKSLRELYKDRMTDE